MRTLESRLATTIGNYRPVRPAVTPFPIESVITWCWLLGLQRHLGVSGDALEIGVEHGGTAFLLAVELEANERLSLVDIKRSPRFDEVFQKLDEATKNRIEFHLCSSQSELLESRLKADYRFVHIDGGHQKADVLHDFDRFSKRLSANGVLCLDDIFEIRWPGVTEAAFEIIPNSGFEPILLVDRKLYLAREREAATYRRALRERADTLELFARSRMWTETMFGREIIIIKMSPTINL